MKILIVGQQKEWAIEHHFVRYLSTEAEVEVYAAEDVFDDFYRKSTLHKIWYKSGLSTIEKRIGE